MSVSVDYDDDSGVDVIYSVWGSDEWLADVHGAVDDRGEDIYTYLKMLDDSAEYAAEYAMKSVEKLKNFYADVTQVTFNTPPAPTLGLEALSIAPIDTSFASPSGPLSASIPMPPFATPKDPSVMAPANINGPKIPAPPQLGAGVEIPYAPATYVFPDTEVPEFVVGEFTETAIDAPALDSVSFTLPEPITFEPLELPIVDMTDLEEAIERLQNMPTEMVAIPGYDNLLPEIFTVTGSLLNGVPNFDVDSTGRELIDLRDPRQGVVEVFARRKIDVADIATDWVEQAAQARLIRVDAKWAAEVAEKCIVEGYRLATAAVMMQNDIELKLYELAFAAARARAMAFLEIAKATSAIYAAQLLTLQTAAAYYNAQSAQLRAEATAFIASTKAAQYTGDLNQQLAALFATEEQAKGVDADLFKTRVKAEATKLDAYRSQIETYAAALAEAEAAVAAYTAVAEKYAAEVAQLASGYELAATKARAVASENRAKATATKASVAQLKSLAASAQTAASKAAAQSVQLNAKALLREVPHDLAAVGNDEASSLLSTTALNYAARMANYVSDMRGKSVELGAQTDYGQLLSRFYERASNSAERAANVTSRANEELARAYASVYEAAGRAGAAIESGKLSGFRASTTLSAGDALSASENRSVNYGTQGSNNYSEQYSRSLNYSD